MKPRPTIADLWDVLMMMQPERRELFAAQFPEFYRLILDLGVGIDGESARVQEAYVSDNR